MRKQEFLSRLMGGLSGLPHEDILERLNFYSEMIDDRMEEGLSEEEAVAQIGDVEEIISQIIAETPLTKLVKENITSKRKLKTWEIVLLALGSPIWFSLLVAAVAVVLSLYIALWAVLISLWATFASVAACAVAGIVAGGAFAFGSYTYQGIALIGAGLVCAGLSILLFYGCKAATDGTLLFTKKSVIWLKNRFAKKEVAQ